MVGIRFKKTGAVMHVVTNLYKYTRVFGLTRLPQLTYLFSLCSTFSFSLHTNTNALYTFLWIILCWLDQGCTNIFPLSNNGLLMVNSLSQQHFKNNGDFVLATGSHSELLPSRLQ